MNVKRKKRKLFLAVLCCIITLCRGMEVSAKNYREDTQYDIRVTYGYDNSVKLGRTAVFHVSVENQGEAFSGTVKLMTSSYMEEGYFGYSSLGLNLPHISASTVRYYDNYGLEKELSIASGETKTVAFVLPFTSSAPYVKVLLIDAEGECAAEKIVRLSVRSASAEILTGILTDIPEGLEYMNGVHLSKYSNTSVSIVFLTEHTFEDTPEGLDMLDVVIADDFRMDRLSLAQKNALRQFVLQGGILVIGNGNGSETAGNPGEPDTRYYGDGKILTYPGSLALYGEKRYSNQVRQTDMLFEEFLSKDRLTDLDSGGYYLNTDEYWNVVSRLASTDEGNIPEMEKYVFVLLVYVVLAGPVVYLVLKKLKVRKYIWGCVGVLAVGFSAVIFLMGSSTRFNAPFINYVRKLQITDGFEDECVEFGVRAPYNKSYSVFVNRDYELLPVSEGVYYQMNNPGTADFSRQSIGIFYGDEEIRLTMAGERAFTEKYFKAKKNIKKGEDYGFFGSLNYFDGTVTGTLENCTGYDLEDACVLFRNHLIYIGDFPADSKKDIGKERLYFFSSGYGYQMISSCLNCMEGYTKEISEEYLETAWRGNLLSGCLREGYNIDGELCTLVGFVRDGQIDLMEDSAYKMYGQTMVCTDVDLTFEEKIQGQTWVYDPFVTATAEVISGNFDLYSNVYYSREVVLMYTMPKDLTDMSLTFGENAFFNEEYYKDFTGTAELYNYEKGSYEAVSVDEEISWNQLKSCVSDNGQFMVRYQRVTDTQDQTELLPVIIVKGRRIYAQD